MKAKQVGILVAGSVIGWITIQQLSSLRSRSEEAEVGFVAGLWEWIIDPQQARLRRDLINARETLRTEQDTALDLSTPFYNQPATSFGLFDYHWSPDPEQGLVSDPPYSHEHPPDMPYPGYYGSLSPFWEKIFGKENMINMAWLSPWRGV